MKKKILILGGSSDIGVQVINKMLKKNWKVTAHYSKNKKTFNNFSNSNSNLSLIKCDFSKINENNCQKMINKVFKYDYDALINLVGYVDNISYQNSDLKSLIKSLKINCLVPMLVQRKVVKEM